MRQTKGGAWPRPRAEPDAGVYFKVPAAWAEITIAEIRGTEEENRLMWLDGTGPELIAHLRPHGKR